MNKKSSVSLAAESFGFHDGVQVSQRRAASVCRVMLLALAYLMAAHLAVKEYFPNPVFWVIGALFIVVAGVVSLLVRKDNFGFILVLFVCAHFAFADNQGGIWSYVICAVLLLATVMGHRSSISLSSVPISISIFVLIFAIHQFIGTVVNPYSLISNIQAAIVTVSQIIIFYYIASQNITIFNFKRLLSVIFLVAIWVFVIGLNQHFHWIITSSPLFPTFYREAGRITSIPLGPFGNSELFSEYFCIVFIFALVIFIYNKELRFLYINRIWPLFIVLIAPLALILGTSRAAIILAIMSTCIVLFFNLFLVRSTRNLKRSFTLMTVLSLVVIVILSFGSLLSINALRDKLKELDFSKINIHTIASGKEINRDLAYNAAFRQFKSKSWWIGYGYNLPENNIKSMGLKKGSADYHSLYLSLPIFYGWAGAVSYVLIVVFTAFKSFICYFKERHADHWLVPITLGFAVMWFVFLLDQYKISVTRNPGYFLLSWMWLGLNYAIINTLRKRNVVSDECATK